MSLRINTNMASINAQRQLSSQEQRLSHSMKALSSGNRIMSASDDAAGLAISENLKSNLVGNRMAKRNAEDAISMIQVGEGSLNEVNNILVRLRELSIQSASGTLSDKERGFIDLEAQQLVEEIDRIAESTRMGEKFLINGSNDEFEFHIGTDGSDNSVIKYSSRADATASSLRISSVDLSSSSRARSALGRIDDAIYKVGEMRASFGAVQNRLSSAISNLDVSHESLSEANSRIRDADIASESADMTRNQILQQASVSMLAQANQSKATALKLIA
jgi:flagellin